MIVDPRNNPGLFVAAATSGALSFRTTPAGGIPAARPSTRRSWRSPRSSDPATNRLSCTSRRPAIRSTTHRSGCRPTTATPLRPRHRPAELIRHRHRDQPEQLEESLGGRVRVRHRPYLQHYRRRTDLVQREWQLPEHARERDRRRLPRRNSRPVRGLRRRRPSIDECRDNVGPVRSCSPESLVMDIVPTRAATRRLLPRRSWRLQDHDFRALKSPQVFRA